MIECVLRRQDRLDFHRFIEMDAEWKMPTRQPHHDRCDSEHLGDDGPAPSPSVGRDTTDPRPLTVLGPCVGDDGQESDLRLKQDVRCVGTTVFGLPLYHFKYLGKPET